MESAQAAACIHSVPNVTEAAMAAAMSEVFRDMMGALNAAWRSRTGKNMRRATDVKLESVVA